MNSTFNFFAILVNSPDSKLINTVMVAYSSPDLSVSTLRFIAIFSSHVNMSLLH